MIKTFAAILMAVAFALSAHNANAQTNLGFPNNKVLLGDANGNAKSAGSTTTAIIHGEATLVAGVVTVANTSVLATSRIFVTRKTSAGSAGAHYFVTRSAGVSLTITAYAADGTTAATGDTSVISYLIINP